MPNMYSSSGEENLRADPHLYDGSEKDTPSMKGKDAGGTENLKADFKTFDGPDKPLPTNYSHDVPHGLQSFDDNGQKDGGTQYLGR